MNNQLLLLWVQTRKEISQASANRSLKNLEKQRHSGLKPFNLKKNTNRSRNQTNHPVNPTQHAIGRGILR